MYMTRIRLSRNLSMVTIYIYHRRLCIINCRSGLWRTRRPIRYWPKLGSGYRKLRSPRCGGSAVPRAVRSWGSTWMCRYLRDVHRFRRFLWTGSRMFNGAQGVEDDAESRTEESVVYGQTCDVTRSCHRHTSPRSLDGPEEWMPG